VPNVNATPPLPGDRRLRAIAEAIEANGAIGELMDHKWRIVFITSELCRMLGFPPEDAGRFYGLSPIIRNRDHADLWGTDDEGGGRWWQTVGPTILHDVPPEDPDFEAVFGGLTRAAAELEPASPPPLAIPIKQSFPGLARMHHNWLGDVEFLYARLHDEGGSLVGVLNITRPALPATLAARLARGNVATFERMGRLSEPERRPAAILFADLEASGDLSRRLSSRAYFGLIRSLTDLIDGSVTAHGGITGKHAGDGASALFVVEGGDESTTARGAIAAARAIRAGAGELIDEGGVEICINVGLHWGATLMVGQVSAAGRLEVTALGDEMNEAARIEGVASAGAILGSKPLIERLGPEDAAELGIDPDGLAYRPLSELGASEKALRDAGTIAVAEL
jgi:class 3 adenylate cyclase